jgi:mannose-6-phosphate isomerase-like protein (cupin superfamily)
MKRVVTGHDAHGNAVIAIEGPPPVTPELSHIPGTVFYEIWNTNQMPVPIDNGPDPTARPLRIPPTPNGSVIRFVDIPPDTPEFLAQGAARMAAAFKEVGSHDASTVKADSPHPLMHRTESVDYGIVIEGEITLIVDQGESLLRAGDVVVQRGTNHAWANRSGKMARMVFVLLDGTYEPGIAAALKGR